MNWDIEWEITRKTHKFSLEKQIVKPEKNEGKRKETTKEKERKNTPHSSWKQRARWLWLLEAEGLHLQSVSPGEDAQGLSLYLPTPSPLPTLLAQVNISFSAFNAFVVFYHAKVLFKIFSSMFRHDYIYIFGIIHYRFRVQKSFFCK